MFSKFSSFQVFKFSSFQVFKFQVPSACLTFRHFYDILFKYHFSRLRWDYLTKSESNMTGKTVGAMKAFNWIKKHGVTISQVREMSLS